VTSVLWDPELSFSKRISGLFQPLRRTGVFRFHSCSPLAGTKFGTNFSHRTSMHYIAGASRFVAIFLVIFYAMRVCAKFLRK
jgi:hypothetical protein